MSRDRMHGRVGSLSMLAFVLCLCAARRASADPTTHQCLAASEQAISLREQHRLTAERESLLVCASSSCPPDVQRECAHRVDEVDAAIPSIVFDAKDAAGNDLGAVRVTVDGKPLADALGGIAFRLDPGEHVFVFETEGETPIRKKIILVEGAKDRHESIVFGALRSAPQASRAETPPAPEIPKEKGSRGGAVRFLGWPAFGLGVVGLSVGAAFAIVQAGKQKAADTICPSGACPVPPGGDAKRVAADSNARIADLTNQANSAGTIAVAGFVTGGVLAATGVVLLLTAPSSKEEIAFAPALAPGLAGIGATGRF